eukprot:TRINITY_DN27123_c0_g1_i1.p1 TRINITY_DN27123_c0_g1~~TRINITY_DN27123_c0_g1_i1.p1  ORF type:complete len:262 (+),score=78.07 TRINITY_DN27123_c0_g1_i1:72-788(+)
MSAVAQQQHDLLENLLAELEGKLESITPDNRDGALKSCNETVKEYKKALVSLKVETRSLGSTDEAQRYHEVHKSFKTKLTSLTAQIKNAGSEGGRRAIAGTGGDDEDEMGDRGPGRAAVEQTFDKIHGHQKDALETLEKIEGTVADTEQTAHRVNEELDRQGQLIADIDAKLDELGDDVTRAKQELSAFARRMATDKLILCFMCVLVLGIVIAIGVNLASGGEDDGNTPIATDDESQG